MKLFKKKNKDEEINEAQAAGTELAETVEEQAGEPAEKKPRDLKFALIRCAAALIIAAAALYLTSFAAVSLIKGPADSVTIQNEENGAFIKKEIIAVLGNYAPEGESGYYAVVPMSGELVTVNFTGRYQESVDEIIKETSDYVSGALSQLDKYVIVQGTVAELDEEQSALLRAWFDENRDEMVANYVISDAFSADDYLSEKVLLVDTVDGVNQTLVMALSALALLLVLYVIAELVLMALGFYKESKPKDEAAAEAAAAQGEGLQSSIAAALDAEEAAVRAKLSETEAETAGEGAGGDGMLKTPIKKAEPEAGEEGE